MKKQSLLLFVIPIILAGCDQNKRLISKNIDARFVKFEIVEFRKDSSNVYEASQFLNGLNINTSETGLKIVQGLDKIENKYGNKTPLQIFLIIDSLQKHLEKEFKDFENLRFNRKESCYYVKYLIYKEELKVPKEEYFFISPYNNEVYHRPCDWDQYVVSEGYNELVKEAVQYSGDIMTLRYKFTKKFE